MTLAVFFSFLAAATILAIIPGPGMLFVLAQTSKGGKNAGISGCIGTAVGGMFHVFAGAIGLSAILYASSVAFEIVKIFGAFYLFYLSWKALKEERSITIDTLDKIRFESESLKQGVITEALNPKTALFFLALIPQFINPRDNVTFQFFLLGTTSVILNTFMDLFVVFSSDFLISSIHQSNFSKGSFRFISSLAYFGLGLLALGASRNANS